MAEIRESLISIRSANYKEAEEKFAISFHMDFGTNECTDRMNKIKALGIDPSNNAVAIVHEFATPEAAQKMVDKVNELKAAMGEQMGKLTELFESIKADGKRVVACIRFPPEAAAPLGILNAVAGTMGDFVSQHQFIDFKIADSKGMLDILNDPASPAASAMSAALIKLTLSLHKDLPVKIADFIQTMAPEHEKPKVQMVGQVASSFHHFKLEIELREPTEMMKQAYKNEILSALIGMSQMALSMAEQFGFTEAIKNGGSKTTAMLCLTPMLSFEVNVFAPTTVEAMEKAAAPEFASHLGA